MTASEIAQRSDPAEFDDQRAPGVQAECHPGLEQDVRPRLVGDEALQLVLDETVAQAHLLVGGHQDDTRLRDLKAGVEDVADVGHRLPRLGPQLVPFQRLQTEGSQLLEHRHPRLLVSAVDDEYLARVDLPFLSVRQARGDQLGGLCEPGGDWVPGHRLRRARLTARYSARSEIPT